MNKVLQNNLSQIAQIAQILFRFISERNYHNYHNYPRNTISHCLFLMGLTVFVAFELFVRLFAPTPTLITTRISF